ncbi:MAG: KamA family radical SAM protein [Lachnospiraceae bacterium]|nr:KamA family radical SAM protein [Lachnospiraceae bacterium]
MADTTTSGIIDSAEQLFERVREKGVTLSPLEEAYIMETDKQYRLRISEYYFDLIDWDDPECPIRKQCIPDGCELDDIEGYSEDPLNEKHYEVTPFLIHKYRSRAAFMCSNFCYMHCRHCTRKNTIMNEEICTKDVLPAALEYVRNHTEINDILITGGDPLALPMDTLEYYIAGFRSVPSVNTIRIGTRVIAADPAQITEELCEMLEKYHPLWMFTQFNHPKEVTEEAAKAADRLLKHGIPLGNQSVLLAGINDDADILEELYTKLIGIRIRPYYLYLCDRVKGTAHFATDYTVGVELVEKLRYRLPGYAVPKFIIDADGEHGGKVTVELNHVLKETPDYLLLQGDSEDSVTKFYR